ncbi:hypothetical protein DOI34_24945 [Salmonella enterica subsp. enterica serovar Virchow]|nr:hypothetical protein [Salmonella enterica subsp. enterica serovar Virchow]EBW2353356.1 hypothetical protein [Salmonella enterica subsp. enterica serovar Enteritidis]MIL09703.1 hypothetical protein [Salmonella enterica subsp. enterica serovar Enteritidis]
MLCATGSEGKAVAAPSSWLCFHPLVAAGNLRHMAVAIHGKATLITKHFVLLWYFWGCMLRCINCRLARRPPKAVAARPRLHYDSPP